MTLPPNGRLHIRRDDGRPEMIAWFDDFDTPHEFDALSNFFVGEPITLPLLDDTFMTGEHAFAALKAYRNGRKTYDYRKIRDAADPGLAKMFGQECRLRGDWEAVKYDAMMAVLRVKFTLDRYEGSVLRKTDDALLVEGTAWDDRVWGIALNDETPPLMAPGRNWLGTMLMARRAELRAEAYFGHKHETGSFNELFAIRDH